MRFPALAAFMVAAALGLPRAAAAQQNDAPLRPGDVVMVKVTSETEFTGEFPVETGGLVVLPRKGRVDISKSPASQVPAVVRDALAPFIRPELIVVRALRRVTVVGEVERPGVYHLDPWSTLRDAVASAGAPLQYTDSRHIVLRRAGDVRDIQQWQTSADADAPIASSDVLVVPKQTWLRRNLLNAVSSLGLVVSTIIAVTR